ncbi:hypothetical protein D3C76_1020660 [compost metagenome]
MGLEQTTDIGPADDDLHLRRKGTHEVHNLLHRMGHHIKGRGDDHRVDRPGCQFLRQNVLLLLKKIDVVKGNAVLFEIGTQHHHNRP